MDSAKEGRRSGTRETRDALAIFQFRCEACKRRQDHICTFGEIPEQRCDQCGGGLVHEFVPTRAKAQIFAQDQRGLNPEWTGPRQRQRWLKDRGLVDYEGASAGEVAQHHARAEQHREEREDAEHLKATYEMLDELGDAGLYTSENPSPDLNEPDPDNTGAGVREADEAVV